MEHWENVLEKFFKGSRIMQKKKIGVTGIGNAIIDIIAGVDEEFLDEFEDLCAKLYPSVPTYLSLLRLHQFIGWEKEVCVTGLVSDDYLKVLNWALDCKNMGISVYEGAYFNQPNQLIQAFQTINSTISEFERIKMEKAGEKTKSKGK